MTVEHILMIETNDGVSDQDMREVLDGIIALKDKIPGILDIKIGKNFTDRAPNITYAGVVSLADKEALAGYGPHPAHQELLKILMPVVKNITIADIEA